MNDLTQTLRRFIVENFLFGRDDPFSDENSLLEAGIIDSTGVLELILFLEETYDLTLEDHELVPENLDSIANLTRFVTAKREGVGVGA